jgi:hypothetical protein
MIASVPPILAYEAADAIPSLDGLHVKVDVNAGDPLGGYCHFKVPSAALIA